MNCVRTRALRPRAILILGLLVGLGACAHDGAANRTAATGGGGAFPEIGYATWRDDEPAYRVFPGDVLDVTAPSAVELSRTVTVQPDGRISLPLIGSRMAADRTVRELEAELSQAYAGQLVRPDILVDVKAAVPLRVFVGGEVQKPGIYDMPGDIDALQAVVMAGGFTTLARSSKVVVVRRGVGGRPMMRTADLHGAIFDPASSDAVPLRRFDIIFVPRTDIANAGLFVQQYIRDVVPIEFSYAVTPNAYATVP